MTLALVPYRLLGVVSKRILIYNDSKSPSALFTKRFHGDQVNFIQFRLLQLQTALHSITFLVFAEQLENTRYVADIFNLGISDKLL